MTNQAERPAGLSRRDVETICNDLSGIADLLAALVDSSENSTPSPWGLAFLASNVARLRRDLGRLTGFDAEAAA